MSLSLASIQSTYSNNRMIKCRYTALYLNSTYGSRWWSNSTGPEFSTGETAYDILQVSDTSSFAEIKASFRKLAKETHPDLVESKTGNSTTNSQRFIQILAAYEILSDSEKRAHYDRYLLSKRKIVLKHSRQGFAFYSSESQITRSKEMEVVEWLKWNRLAINDIVSEKKLVVGSGYFDVLEADFYSAIHAAYYGPVIESMDLLPDCFEAEERSSYETLEVLHLVSGRYLFGMVCLVNKIPKLASSCNNELNAFTSVGSGIFQSIEDTRKLKCCRTSYDAGISKFHTSNDVSEKSDAYEDLKLHISGKLVAVATRIPPKNQCDGAMNEDAQDRICVFLISNNDFMHVTEVFSKDSLLNGAVGGMILLGTIRGLGTGPEEGSCFVYDGSGNKTHMIMKHRTLMVKHMLWYEVQGKVSVAECRCSRARLPPSKFWLFEPRCDMHGIGGWYVETFGKDKKGWTVPSQRCWDGFDGNEQCDKRLHPAMYLLALAYRTLDIEDSKRRKLTVRNIIESKLFRMLNWCKKLV